jgi:regulator of sigma E protease
MKRAGQLVTIQVTPKLSGEKYRIGVDPGRTVWQRVSLGQAVAHGVVFPVDYTRFIFHQFGEIFRGHEKAQFSGPPGIVRQLKHQIQRGPGDGLLAVAIISVYLGLFNLLPLPALDGGRLVFLVLEGISRRRVNQRVEQTIHLVGMVALLMLVVFFSVRDFLY